MGKISYKQPKRKRSNSRKSENNQEKVVPINVKQETEVSETSFSEPTENRTAGFNIPPSTPTSLTLNTSASDGSHVFSPAFCHNNISQVTINGSFVVSDTKERNLEPQTQDNADTSTTTILRTPKHLRKSRRSRRSAARCSLIPHAIVGEITGACVTSEYHCSQCSSKIRSWKPPRFTVRCPGCKMSWKCDKVQCKCKANINLEQPGGQMQRVTLEDSLLHSIVRFKQQGYCKTENIEKKVLKVGTVRVVYKDEVVRSVTKWSPSSMSLSDMPDVLPTD